MKSINLKILLCLISGYFLAYNTSYCQNHFSIGANKFGIAIGRPIMYSGVRLNFFDKQYFKKDSVLKETNYQTNGLSFSVINKTANVECNGLQFALINNNIRGQINGVFGGIINVNKLYRCRCYVYNNGITFGAYNYHIKTNGLQLGIFNKYSESWVDVGILNQYSRSKIDIGILNFNISHEGFRMGLINSGKIWYDKRAFEDIWLGIINIKKYQNSHHNFNSVEYLQTIDNNGVQIGLINYCETCKFQVGLFNYIKSKSKFKFIPIMNFKRYK
ncbi:MAG: hypothetical protein A2046_00835 [Bacteroidetes bacterium GWA2_30_7]|nr:MAG: hypothetical protein A2046_00835 [Bacteroidetes bacterium GWA2_30_7]